MKAQKSFLNIFYHLMTLINFNVCMLCFMYTLYTVQYTLGQSPLFIFYSFDAFRDELKI